MEIKDLSSQFAVRKLEPADTELIYCLSCGNEIFYQYHPPFVTRESILEDMAALPPGKDYKDKFYIGFFEGKELVALMDLILDYPRNHVAFIGLFMMDSSRQEQGIGTMIISECASCLAEAGYQKIRLAIDKGNPQSDAFWTKNHFVKTGEEIANGTSVYFPMERELT